jgi:acetylornithine/succinyldiaminopimelate/putrescine aminotransferase
MNDIDFIYENYENLLNEEQNTSYPLPLNIQSAKGSFVIDENGVEYLDLTSNLDTQPFGYSFTSTSDDFLLADSGLFKSSITNKLKQTFTDITGLEQIYFKPSLTSCFEYTSELIKKFSVNSNKSQTLIACSSESKNNYNLNADYLPLNNETILKTVFTKNVNAIIIELVQFSEEILLANESYLNTVKEFCAKNNALLIFDVSNISPYRCSNSLFNYNTEIKPDVLILSKGIANGLPFGCVCLSQKAENIPAIKQETSITLPAKLINDVISNTLEFDVEKKVTDLSEMFINKLEELTQTHISIGNILNNGLIITFDTDYSAYELQKRFFEKQILVEAIAHSKVLLRPSYATTESDIEHFIKTFEIIINEANLFDRMS